MKLLLGCYEVPGWGGASTCSYALFERLQRDGVAAKYLNLVRDSEERPLRDIFGDALGNPRSLAGVHTQILTSPLWQAHPALADHIRKLQPDLLVARGFIAAWLMKRAAPDVPLVFITSGCAQIKRLLRQRAIRDFVDFERRVARGISFAVPEADYERAAVASSDLIVVHSPHVRCAFEHFFPEHMGKVYATVLSNADYLYAQAEPFMPAALPFAERDIDVLFVATRWDRPEKNYSLVRRIAADADGLRLHLVGAVDGVEAQGRAGARTLMASSPHTLAPARSDLHRLPLTYHGIVPRRDDLHALLGRSKAIVCPSLFDAAPGVLFEASAMGCNVVASRNCGNWQLCHEQLLADSPDAFASRIRRATRAAYADNQQLFRGGYDDLLGTLRAFL